MKYIKSIPTKELIEQIVADTNDKAKMEIMQFSGMDDKTLSGVYASYRTISRYLRQVMIYSALRARGRVSRRDLKVDMIFTAVFRT